MDGFPELLQHAVNRIAKSDQATSGVEGYVFHGADGSQMAFGPAVKPVSAGARLQLQRIQDCGPGPAHLTHRPKKIPLRAGEEYFIPGGMLHGGDFLTGTRTIHAFGGHRAERAREP
jgi:hypothetical protein